MTDRLRSTMQAALQLCDWINESPHERGSVNGLAAQVGYGLRAALAEPACKDDLQVAEPFIWYADDTGDTWTPDAVVEGWAPTDLRPLYAVPPRREWQGLTDEEIADLSDNAQFGPRVAKLARIIESALRSKNGSA